MDGNSAFGVNGKCLGGESGVYWLKQQSAQFKQNCSNMGQSESAMITKIAAKRGYQARFSPQSGVGLTVWRDCRGELRQVHRWIKDTVSYG